MRLIDSCFFISYLKFGRKITFFFFCGSKTSPLNTNAVGTFRQPTCCDHTTDSFTYPVLNSIRVKGLNF